MFTSVMIQTTFIFINSIDDAEDDKCKQRQTPVHLNDTVTILKRYVYWNHKQYYNSYEDRERERERETPQHKHREYQIP